MEIVGIVIAVFVVILVIFLWATYNGLVTLRNRVEEAWSDITVQLKRRLDLIPNLVESVKGYAKHEKEVFENVTKARAATLDAKGVERDSRSRKPIRSCAKKSIRSFRSIPTTTR